MTPEKREKMFKIKLTEADKLNLEKLAKRYKLSQKLIVGYLLFLAVKYDLFASGAEMPYRLTEVDQ